MKILLVYGYSQKNAGDLAITLGALDILISKGHKITVVSRYNRSSEEFHDSVRALNDRYGKEIDVLECPFTLNRSDGTLTTFKNYFEGLLYLTGLRNSQILDKAITENDLIIFNGGNLLRCSSWVDYTRLKALFYPLKRGLRLGKEYIIFPQSTAHINKLGERLITSTIRGAKATYIRENLSYKKLISAYNFSNLKRSLDCAFFIQHDSKWQGNEGKKVVGFTLRAQTVGDLGDLSQEEKDLIIQQISETVESLSEKCIFKIVVQTKKDREISYELHDKLKDQGIIIDLIEDYDPVNLIEIFSGIDLLIGMRLHSIILALSCGTPCYGLFFSEWGLKNEGLMREFNLPFTILDSTDKSINLEGVDRLLAEGEECSKGILSIVQEGRDQLRELI